MYNFKAFLKDLSNTTGIKFNLVSEEGHFIFECYINPSRSELYTFPVFLGNKKAYLTINEMYQSNASLLKYIVETKYREMFYLREQLLIDIIEGREVSLEKVENNIPYLSKGCELLLVNVEGSKYEALNIIRQLYQEQEILSTALGDNVIIIGDLKQTEEHARSIVDSITSNLFCKVYVSFSSRIFDVVSLKKAYEDAKECMILGKRFRINEEVFNYDKMLFEKIVYNINDTVKYEILRQFEKKFNSFDSEMITTIEEFANSGLNVSEAAKNLYVHRNTLIYRLDKIKKETGFDIRNFKEATVFVIAFLVWKENK